MLAHPPDEMNLLSEARTLITLEREVAVVSLLRKETLKQMIFKGQVSLGKFNSDDGGGGEEKWGKA